mmetsp:Transcript_50068/g.82998  ORF Transcript_50068/g.82998 Transcript_50068/m.82998 type:complete len:352 (+) Transcript_50068:43-1098(+)
MVDEARHVEDIMRNRTLVGVRNQCRYYVPPGLPPGDRGSKYPGCHWYLLQNQTVPWAAQSGLPGAGSEFSWDTTGQEEAFIWGSYFAREDRAAARLAEQALDQILSYTPLVPNFAWHGSAYGVGDFGNNGFIRGSERVLQHYRSGLNAIPTTEAFLNNPNDTYLIRLAAGSIGGVLANIDENGANSMGFHSDPANLFYDPASGDWGLALFGHTFSTGSFLVRDEDLGYQCFFCDLDVEFSRTRNGTITLTPRDSYLRRVYIAPLGLLIISDAGIIASVISHIQPVSGRIFSLQVTYAPIGELPLTVFRLRLVVRAGNCKFVVAGFPVVRSAYEIPVSSPVVPVHLSCDANV